MLAIRPALFLAVSALALQGCAGINELAGASGMPGFMGGAARNGEFTPGSGSSQSMTMAPVQQSEQVSSLDDSMDAPTTYIQASDPIDAPPPPMVVPVPSSGTKQAMTTPPQPAEAAGRPLMLVPAPGQTMASVQPPPVSPPTPQPMLAQPMVAQSAPQPVPVMQTPAPAPAQMQPQMQQAAALPKPAQNPQSQAPMVRAQGREFIPAPLSSNAGMSITPRPGEIPLTPGQRNVLERFTILDRLLDEGLITRGERDARRAENIGAILAYSMKAPAMGLERDVPNGDAISNRLSALKRSLEMRAITPRQHAVERNMILDALLSSQPRARAMPKAPPTDVIEAAASIGQLERLRSDGVITNAEFDAEKGAIDAYFVTGSFSAAAAPASATQTASMPQALPVVMTPSANLGLHLASYRSQKAAQDGWMQISKKHAAQLGSLNSTIRRVDLGAGKGTFYRLLAGPVQTRDQAASLCQQLKRSSQYCDPLSLGG